MATPAAIPTPPPAPNRGDAPPDFSQKADASTAYWPVMTAAINVTVTWMNGVVTTVDLAKTAAQQAATAAAASAAAAAASQTDMSAQIAQAAAYANNASASATAAESAPGSIGNLALLHAIALSR